MLNVSKLNDIALCTQLRATGHHLSYGITQCYLPPDTGERAPINPSQKGWYSIYLPQRDGRLSWPRWYIPRWFTYPQVVIDTSINRARRRLTRLIETIALTLIQATTRLHLN